MKRVLKRAVTGLLLGAIVVLGGGFASADYSNGDNSASSSATITYTVASFRAIELTNTSIAFGTIRQGGVGTQAGPTVLYGTTWTGDKISVYLDSTTPMTNDVKLYVVPQAPNTPMSPAAGDGCTSVGSAVSGTVTVTATAVQSAQPVVTGITNCGYPQLTASAVSASGYPSGFQPVMTPSNTSWASFTTTLKVDATTVTGSLVGQQTHTLYFIINA